MRRRFRLVYSPLIVFVGYAPSILAQQYCASGTVATTSGNTFKVGDPIAVTANITPNSLSCMTFSPVPGATDNNCNAQVIVNISSGSRYWSGIGVAGSFMAYGMSIPSLMDNQATFHFLGGAVLTPLVVTPGFDSSLAVDFGITDLSANLVASGTLPAALPTPAMVQSAASTNFFKLSGAYSSSTVSYTGQNCATPQGPSSSDNMSAKSLGNCNCSPGGASGGEPINIATGNVFELVTDYSTTGQNPLSFTRTYNSMGATANANTLATSLGMNWRSNYDRYLNIVSSSSVFAERADGQVLTFTLTGGSWKADSDVDVSLTNAGSTWTLTDHDDTVETYIVTGSKGVLSSIVARNGYQLTLNYSGGQLSSVSDSYGRSLNLTYSGGLLQTVATPDSSTITYGYTPLSGKNVLTSVGYSTMPATIIAYQYQNSAFPFALTGLIDENDQQFGKWTYDSNGRGIASQQGGLGANLTTLAYNSDGTTTVTNALGVPDTYTFQTLQGIPKVTKISRAATPSTAAAVRTFGYDFDGYLSSSTDWNGIQTMFLNNSHGQPTLITDAAGTAQARTTIIEYDPTFVHLPSTIITQGLMTNFTYDGSGNVIIRKQTDTTLNLTPYITNGTSRIWTNTWTSTGQLASVTGPRTDIAQKTQYGYDSTGALISITDALGHVTSITVHSGGGLPETIVDPNGVTTNLTYSPRQWLLTSTLSTSAGPLTTTLTYDASGNLVGTTLPDGSTLANSYDAAHRLTGVTDLFSQSTSYTLDANGNRTESDILDATQTTQRKHSATFDALSRVLNDIGGVGQTTAYTYDANGNALTITDPLTHVTKRAFDPLNRLVGMIDAAGGTTTLTYDPHDRPLTVVDSNGGTTGFVYDGFGDVIQRTSPDTGTTVYRYDLAGNVTQKTDATGATTNITYDALNRPLTTTYPADAAENVTYTYDQTGNGFGIGRLTSVTDAAGTLSRTYDERGNILTQTRVYGSATLVTSTAYDAVSRVASITYPSGWTAIYTRDAMGRVTALSAQAPAGGPPSPVVSGIGYQPFGPFNALAYGNGIAETRSFDLDYRLLNLADTGTVPFQNLTYAYYGANNVSSITDGVTAANTQNLAYDVLDHLNSAIGNYGNLAYTYSPIGNRLTQTIGGVLTNYTYAPASNQLATITSAGTTQTLTTTAAGNISRFAPGLGTVTNLTYNQANRLSTASAGPNQLAQYTYDAFGHRIVKVGSATATTVYQYDGAGHLLEENDGQGNSIVDYVYLDHQPVATIDPVGGNVYFLHDDRLGTPQLATDASQTIQWMASYEPFGSTSTGAGLIVQNLRLPGQEYDIETGLYHNGFRDYVPSLGRYLESDPIGLAGGANGYVYVSGDPLKLSDRRGLQVDVAIDEGEQLIEELPQILSEIQEVAAELTTEAEAVVAEANQLPVNYWPPNGGFCTGPASDLLSPGTILQRWGGTEGTYLSPYGTLPEMLSLAPGTTFGPYVSYTVIQPLPVLSGPAAAWFGQLGGGVQYQTYNTIQWLIDQGYLK